jgi:hypothetical protein
VAGLARGFSKVGEYGRLAGFTNQLVAPNRAGRQPCVLFYQATGTVSPAEQQYLSAVEQQLGELRAKIGKQLNVEKTRRVQPRDRGYTR